MAKSTKGSGSGKKVKGRGTGRPFEKGKQAHPGKPFVKGKSGNPGGRPRLYETVVTQSIVKKLGLPLQDEFSMDELTEMGLVTDAEKRTAADAVAHQFIVDAFASPDPNVRYRNRTYLVDRAEGKARQQVDVTGVGGDLAHRSNEDLKYYKDHDYWPEEAPASEQVQSA